MLRDASLLMSRTYMVVVVILLSVPGTVVTTICVPFSLRGGRVKPLGNSTNRVVVLVVFRRVLIITATVAAVIVSVYIALLHVYTCLVG